MDLNVESTIACWKAEQSELKKRLTVEDDMEWTLLADDATRGSPMQLRLIGGMDISFFPTLPHPGNGAVANEVHVEEEKPERGVAALVVLSFPVRLT